MGVLLHLGVRDANLALGGVLAERGATAEAAALYDEAIAMAEERGWLPSAVVTAVERVRLDAGVDGPAAGLAGLERLRRTIAGHPVGPEAVGAIDALEAALLVAASDSLARAAELIDGLRPGVRRRVLSVRLALASGDTSGAADLLAGVGPANLRERLVVDLLTARLAAMGGDHATRDRHLRAAADRARAQGFRRIFLDETPELVPALRSLADERTELQPLVDEVESLASSSTHGRAEPLTDREISVLRYLQSRLTHQEIAGELGISTNTLKTHTRALYRKLGAGSRADAVAAALRAGLL
jgi:LuxR family maltose regulon positive regulatory protein